MQAMGRPACLLACAFGTFGTFGPFLQLWAGPSSRIVRRAQGFSGFGSDFDEDIKTFIEDSLFEHMLSRDLDERGVLRNLTVTIANDTKVTLVGTNHISQTAARFAERIVADVQPSALILELCSERLETLIRGNGHRDTKAKNWMDPDEPEVIRRQHARYADETRRTFRAFMKGTVSKASRGLLVLADMKASVVEHDIEILGDPLLDRRDPNLAANIYCAAMLGHKNIVAVLGANHLSGVAQELEHDGIAMPQHGLYISPSGCKKLQERQRKLKKKVPAKKWKRRESLPDQGRNMKIRLGELCNHEKILNSLGKDALEPSSWEDLEAWHREGWL